MREFSKTTLHAGPLAFSALTEGEGPLVLCLHGFPDGNRSFREQMPALAAAGYKAVAPFLRGYEPSSQPKDGGYHVVRLAEDVIGWLDDLKADKVHIVGHDWGAIVGYAACTLAPQRFKSLTTIAVPHLRRMNAGIREHPGQLRNSWYMLFFQLRGFADFAVERQDFAFIERLWRDWSPGWNYPKEEMDEVKKAFRQPGVLKAALGYYRALFDLISPAARESIRLTSAKVQVPTLALTGETDGCMDTRLYDAVMYESDFPKGLKMERLAGAGHFLHQEKPDKVNPLIVEWIKKHSD
ncbi:MAG: alpha/beta hydrolase [Bdellovibrionota bacterium]